MPKRSTIYNGFFFTADSHEAAALPSRQKNADKASREPATDRQLRMTMLPQDCLGRPLLRGPDGGRRANPAGSKTERRTGSSSGRLASCPMKSICRCMRLSLNGLCPAMARIAALETRLTYDGGTRKIFRRQRAWNPSNRLRSHLFTQPEKSLYTSFDTIHVLKILSLRARLCVKCAQI